MAICTMCGSSTSGFMAVVFGDGNEAEFCMDCALIVRGKFASDLSAHVEVMQERLKRDLTVFRSTALKDARWQFFWMGAAAGVVWSVLWWAALYGKY